MRGYIRQFFWGSIIFALLMVFTNFTSFPSKPEITAIDANQKIAENQTVAMTMPMGAIKSLGQLDPRSRTTVIDGRAYVFIDGKWYPKTTDNIYVINGEKIYFVDNYAPKEQPKGRPRANIEPSDSALLEAAKNPLSAYNPGQIKQMIDTLDRAKAKMKERDEALKALSTAD